MKGEGFRDVILNFAHLFEVVLPPDLQEMLASRRRWSYVNRNRF